MNLPSISGLEGIFSQLGVFLTQIATVVRDLLNKFIPAEYQSLVILIAAFLAGYYSKEKLPLPSWVLFAITIFIVFRYL